MPDISPLMVLPAFLVGASLFAWWSLGQLGYMDLYQHKTGIRCRWTNGPLRKPKEWPHAATSPLGQPFTELDISELERVRRDLNRRYWLFLGFTGVCFVSYVLYDHRADLTGFLGPDYFTVIWVLGVGSLVTGLRILLNRRIQG